jgi:hypothetical protein
VAYCFRFFSDEEIKAVSTHFRNHIERGLKPPTKDLCEEFMRVSGLQHLDWKKVKDAVRYRSQLTIRDWKKQHARKCL